MAKDFSALLAEALKIIGPTADRKKVSRALGYGRMYVERQRNSKKSGRYGVHTERQKKAAKHFGVALHGLEIALRNLKHVGLHRSVSDNFPMDERDIKQWRDRAEKAAASKLDNSNFKFESRLAVRYAAGLLKSHRIELTTTRKGRFCRLAAVFYGDPRANLYDVVREYMRKAEVTS